MPDDFRIPHRDALAIATRYVERVTAADLARATPCQGWDLGQLLGHMVAQHVVFALVVRDGDAPADAYDPVLFTTSSWHASSGELLDAFAAADLDDRVIEAELDPERPLPIAVLVAAQYLDTVVHTWDIAATLGDQYTPPEPVAQTMSHMADRIPDDKRRRQPAAAFGPGTSSEGTSWQRTLASLGRDPSWPSSLR